MNNPIKNWANYLNKHFTKKGRQMSNNVTKKRHNIMKSLGESKENTMRY